LREGRSAHGAVVILTVVVLLLSGVTLAVRTAHAATSTITATQSGLVAYDSMFSGDTSSWTFGNSGLLVGTYSSSEDSQGLHLGSQSTIMLVDWSYSGAASPATAASLFHSIVSLPYTSVPDGQANTGVYVEGQNGNFVECGAVADQTGHYWIVGTGSAIGSTMLFKSDLNQPTSQSCTVITNGSSYLKVYVGGSVVYESSTLALGLSSPLRGYLQLGTSSMASMHSGTFVDYYATQGELVTVMNAPPGGVAQIVDAANSVLESATVDSSGTASLLVGMFSLPIIANIDVYDTSNALVASTPAPAPIWGGDAYRVSGVTTSSSTASSTTTSSSITTSTSSSTNTTTTTTITTTTPTTTTTTITTTTSTTPTTTSTSTSSTSITSTTTTTSVLGGITVYAHRVPASYWDPCFATTCSAGTGPGTSMYIALLDSNGNLVQAGFADENGTTFSGLTPGTTYYVYPSDCENCHGSVHTVQFDHWGDDGSATRPRPTAVGSSLDAWYTCTNMCQ
jgi:hypothetical protein